MRKIKILLRDWLGIFEQRDFSKELDEAVERYRHEATIEFERIVKQMKPISCINCETLLIEGRDAIYTNFKGQKFCSHNCIDKHLSKDSQEIKQET